MKIQYIIVSIFTCIICISAAFGYHLLDSIRYESTNECTDPNQLYALGLKYYAGTDTEQDYLKAEKFLTKSAELDNAQAQNLLAYMHLKGEGVEKNKTLALYWAQRSADQNNPNGMMMLANMYENGDGGTINYNTARQWREKAIKTLTPIAEQGDEVAQFQLGQVYEAMQQNDEAYHWYKKSAEQGDLLAVQATDRMIDYETSRMLDYEDLGDYDEVIKRYEKEYQMERDPDIAYRIGWIYETFKWDPMFDYDYQKAANWYQKAADQGHAKAQGRLGRMYLMPCNGTNPIPQDTEKGLNLLMSAIAQGDTEAMHTLGYAYDYGEGVEQNRQEAIRLYRMAAVQGEPTSADRLNELGVPLEEP